MTTMKEIADAINSIPEKKQKVREALESLRAHSSSLSSFTLEWEDLEAHFATAEKSIDKRFQALLQQRQDAGKAAEEAAEEEEEEEEEKEAEKEKQEEEEAPDAASRAITPELRSLCANMDAGGLRSYIKASYPDVGHIVDAAVQFAADPALLILDAVEGFHAQLLSSAKGAAAGEVTLLFKRGCMNLLGKLYSAAPEVKPSVRERAKKLAAQWRPNAADNDSLECLGFLRFIALFKLVSDYPLDYILELFVIVARMKKADHGAELIKSLGIENKLPDIIQKMDDKGKQLVAVKLVYALNVADKFPPVPFLKAYVARAKKAGEEVMKARNNSLQSQHEAITRERDALKAVLRHVEEYKLEAEYPREVIVERITQLQHERIAKKRTTTTAPSSYPKPWEQQPNKRLHLSTPAAVSAAANLRPPLVQSPHQLGLADRAPYMGAAGPYSLAATGPIYNYGGSSSVYTHEGPGFSSTAIGLGGVRNPPKSYYPPQPVVDSSSLYNRPVTYNGYSLSGLPPPNGSLYP